MGSHFSRQGGEEDEESNASGTAIEDLQGGDSSRGGTTRRGRKRKQPSEQGPGCSKDGKRFKLDTPQYVYQKLFLGGHNSDVTLTAVCRGMKRSWRLHRVYLEQCEYFRALFQRNRWKDSDRKEYTLDVIDKNICFEGLDNVLASLYNNEIEIDKDHVAGVVGAAALLNLKSVLNQCSEILNTYLADDTLLLCLDLADTYGFTEQLEQSLAYAKHYFWRCCLGKRFLTKLTPYWFTKILSSAECLCMKENEMDLYTAMRNWIYLQHNPPTEGDEESVPLNERHVREFFNNASSQYDWTKYHAILRHLRVQHLVLSTNSIKVIKHDRMIPVPLVEWTLRDAWNTMLINEEAVETLDESIEDDFFYRHCFRLGRSDISGSQETTWRWLGYSFGLDLLVKYFAGTLKLTRNCSLLPSQQQLSVKMQPEMRIHYRVIVVANEGGKVLLDTQRCSGILRPDRSLDVGHFRVPPAASFSVHLFHLISISAPSSTHYWDNFLEETKGTSSATGCVHPATVL